MPPKAQIAHISPGRVRLRIAAKRGDTEFFDRLKRAWDGWSGAAPAGVNAATGSLLITGEAATIGRAADFGRENEIFDLVALPPHPGRLIQDTAGPFVALNSRIKALSGGTLDLPSALFAALLLTGLLELLRGNWKSPPWYTAFWYAAGIYSKSLLDKVGSGSASGAGNKA